MKIWEPTHPELADVLEVAAKALGVIPGTLKRPAEDNPPKLYAATYSANEIIMPRGAHGEYAAFLVEGQVRVYAASPDLEHEPAHPKGCWEGTSEAGLDRPLSRWTTDSRWTALHEVTTANDVSDRLLGVTSAWWNLPRSFTLAAGPQGCNLLLLKRKVLEQLFSRSKSLWQCKLDRFREQELPSTLAENRLFRHKHYLDDAREEDWARVLRALQARRLFGNGSIRRLRRRLGKDVMTRLSRSGADAARDLVRELNRLLTDRNLYDELVWPAAKLGREAERILGKGIHNLTQNELVRLNRLVLEHEFPYLKRFWAPAPGFRASDVPDCFWPLLVVRLQTGGGLWVEGGTQESGAQERGAQERSALRAPRSTLHPPLPSPANRLRALLGTEFQTRVDNLSPRQLTPEAREEIIRALNGLLSRDDLDDAAAWPEDDLGIEARTLALASRHGVPLSEYHKLRFRRLLVEHAYPELRQFVRPRALLHPADLTDAQWEELLRKLTDSASPLRALLPNDFRNWLSHQTAALDTGARRRLIDGLNALIALGRLYDPDHWPDSDPSEEVERLRKVTSLGPQGVAWLNRLYLEAVLPGILPSCLDWRPLSHEDLLLFIRWAERQYGPRAVQVEEYVKKVPRAGAAPGQRTGEEGRKLFILESGKAATGELCFVLSGNVKQTGIGPGGPVLLQQLGRHGFFGYAHVDERGIYRSSVEAISNVSLVRLSAEAVALLVDLFPSVGDKLRQEIVLQEARYQDVLEARLKPPEDPLEESASKLLLATNLLAIDMEACVRCDECVIACAEMHGGIPRFHRANPGLRFDKWEISGACAHCSDAPCQTACPVGAITFLQNGIVQIHRDRCTGCAQCPPACPFDAIEMIEPPLDEEVSNLTPNANIATKCDRCLAAHRDPPCVVRCPYGASRRATPLELFPGLKKWEEGSAPTR